MAGSLLDELEAQSQKLSWEEQVELAHRLLRQAEVARQQDGKHSIMELFGIGQGTWKSAEEIDRYIEEERNSWDSQL